MTYKPHNLFDPRGGSLCANRCEVCNEELDEESLVSTCPECSVGEEDES